MRALNTPSKPTGNTYAKSETHELVDSLEE
jgi:aspartate/methionine/tyrosine aminotransferase